MRQLQARVCRESGSVHLVVPESDFRYLGGDEGIGSLQVEIRCKSSQINRNRLPAHGQMLRYREILKLKDHMRPKEIAQTVHVSDAFVSAVCREFGSYGLDTIRTHLTRYACRPLEDMYGIENPTLSDLQKAIEVDPIWRLKMLRRSTLDRVREVELVCQEQGIRIEPAISGNNCAGLTVKSYEKVRALTGSVPKAGDIKALIERGNCDSVFAEDLEFGRELHAFYDYKAANKWL